APCSFPDIPSRRRRPPGAGRRFSRSRSLPPTCGRRWTVCSMSRTRPAPRDARRRQAPAPRRVRLAWLVPIGLAAAALLADLPRAAVERAFSTGWYPRLQPVLTGLSGLLPFALLDLLLVGAGVLLVVRIA